MAQGKRNALAYPYPLPVEPLTLTIGLNPLSWIVAAYSYWRSYPRFITYADERSPPRGCDSPMVVTVDTEPYRIFKVTSTEDMNTLWRLGFFGKGSLSRSDPAWMVRAARRVLGDTSAALTGEEITNQRRQERMEFKTARERLQRLELEVRRGRGGAGQAGASPAVDPVVNPAQSSAMEPVGNPAINPVVLESLEEERARVAKLREGIQRGAKRVFQKPSMLVRPEDTAILDPSGEGLLQLEYLQLMPCEVVYLAILGRIVVPGCGSPMEVLDMVTNRGSDFQELARCVVYHHYRSHGWCVRSGVKFGTEFLLYRGGPPFTHAEHAVMVMTGERLWVEMSAKARVIAGVKKNMVMTYVEHNPAEGDEDVWSGGNVGAIYGQFKVVEIGYRRWVPSRNRE